MKKNDHQYSGDRSEAFWQRVGALKFAEDHAALYSLGCALQTLEEYVLRRLANAENEVLILGGRRERASKKRR